MNSMMPVRFIYVNIPHFIPPHIKQINSHGGEASRGALSARHHAKQHTLPVSLEVRSVPFAHITEKEI